MATSSLPTFSFEGVLQVALLDGAVVTEESVIVVDDSPTDIDAILVA